MVVYVSLSDDVLLISRNFCILGPTARCTERSFGVRAARCRFFASQLAGGCVALNFSSAHADLKVGATNACLLAGNYAYG